MIAEISIIDMLKDLPPDVRVEIRRTVRAVQKDGYSRNIYGEKVTKKADWEVRLTWPLGIAADRSEAIQKSLPGWAGFTTEPGYPSGLIDCWFCDFDSDTLLEAVLHTTSLHKQIKELEKLHAS